jgi:hypothetical protein
MRTFHPTHKKIIHLPGLRGSKIDAAADYVEIALMACRIDNAVIRGEIDNTTEGKTSGRIWLSGRKEPLILDLQGDCLRDVAGCLLTFTNPSPQLEFFPELASQQVGTVGDITASRKMQVSAITDSDPDADLDNAFSGPDVWKNHLSIEWFSESNGRVIIETSEFSLTLSEPAWRMDEEQEQIQKLANLQAMRDAMGQIIRRPARSHSLPSGDDDEFVWEARLKESDRLSEAYLEVREKYRFDQNSDQKEAFAMGWDGILSALNEGDDEDDLEDEDEFENEVSLCDDSWLDDGGEEADEMEYSPHPLQEKAGDLVVQVIDITQGIELQDVHVRKLTTCLIQVASKLASALNGDYEREKGFVLAILKRCLSWQNEAVAACRDLIEKYPDSHLRTSMQQLAQSILEIRDEIVSLRRSLREN